jgi:hypothetical protein
VYLLCAFRAFTVVLLLVTLDTQHEAGEVLFHKRREDPQHLKHVAAGQCVGVNRRCCSVVELVVAKLAFVLEPLLVGGHELRILGKQGRESCRHGFITSRHRLDKLMLLGFGQLAVLELDRELLGPRVLPLGQRRGLFQFALEFSQHAPLVVIVSYSRTQLSEFLIACYKLACEMGLQCHELVGLLQ